MLTKKEKTYMGVSPVHNYIYRHPAFEYMSLYEWISHAEKTKRSRRSKKSKVDDARSKPMPDLPEIKVDIDKLKMEEEEYEEE